MIDMHHDLLSIMYYCYLRDDYSYLDSWIKNFRADNVSGLLANLYFMNREEMNNEIGNKEIDVVQMFKKSVEIFKKYLKDEDVIFSIEGCDYIKDTNELVELYNLGLRNILLVWNNPNKYGSGNRDNYGLTDLGKDFIKKAIELGISIDLSHMNKNTFYDTISLIKEEMKLGHKVKVIASHSNAYSICNHMRNLDDEQIKALGSVNGILGIVAYGPFVRNEDSKEDYQNVYLEQVSHAVDLLGINNVGVSTDDMTFATALFNEDEGDMVFNYSNVSFDMRNLLRKKYSDSDIDKILYKNVYNKLFKEENL
jgi:membrane dipeptidase